MFPSVESPASRSDFRVPAPGSRMGRPLLACDELNIALCVPLRGTAGIWGPSSLACAELAVAELNREAGVGGRSCRLLTVNASDDATDIEATLLELVQAGDIDAIIGMHTSAVRQRVLRAVGGQIPIVYTPLYEGGESTRDVFAIGETSARQLQPAIAWLGERKRPRRWFAVGNDYVWPHMSHHLARRYIAEAGATLVGETYIPLGTTDFSAALDAARQSQADAVLVSLIGQDSIEFNRAFGRAGLHRDMLRLSCAIGENELLGIGADNAEELYVASGYFATLDTDANAAFKERYHAQFGQRAPTLNTFGQSTYEGMHFLAALLGVGRRSSAGSGKLGNTPLNYHSARDGRYAGGGITRMPIYLARAEGHEFRVITTLI
ncbi:ABC-type branched-subunit amino acid transport system substrate-binding protein [Variovorax paradoxus]|uniref:ABC-type branched-subunit amino acid transport system substrate-binding protein n=1 Tax=Variovorax paradoxus TaxID=34073 RepID=A0AAW8E9I4_VARPD|nr:substrate-binding domain-containing protein [Variovorax paradoxus]MDP9968944.1 ABC-type branched-subunit amino acid transport system substrate-binding protein [Variovorax paradoxus]